MVAFFNFLILFFLVWAFLKAVDSDRRASEARIVEEIRDEMRRRGGYR
jgi:hypothetical protein